MEFGAQGRRPGRLGDCKGSRMDALALPSKLVYRPNPKGRLIIAQSQRQQQNDTQTPLVQKLDPYPVPTVSLNVWWHMPLDLRSLRVCIEHLNRQKNRRETNIFLPPLRKTINIIWISFFLQKKSGSRLRCNMPMTNSKRF